MGLTPLTGLLEASEVSRPGCLRCLPPPSAPCSCRQDPVFPVSPASLKVLRGSCAAPERAPATRPRRVPLPGAWWEVNGSEHRDSVVFRPRAGSELLPRPPPGHGPPAPGLGGCGRPLAGRRETRGLTGRPSCPSQRGGTLAGDRVTTLLEGGVWSGAACPPRTGQRPKQRLFVVFACLGLSFLLPSNFERRFGRRRLGS